MEQEPIGDPRILFEDERLVATWKPNRMLVHRTKLDYYERQNLRRWLADRLDQKVDPIHRLDKPTSGIVLFAKDVDALNHVKTQFLDHTVQKEYIALVRGYTEAQGEVEKPLQKEGSDEAKEAFTAYETLYHVEVPIEVSRYPQSRYSLVNVKPRTGRFHQIRLHFSHLRHPILGDSKHGDRKHNHMFRDQLNLAPLFLHAHSLSFQHPNGSAMKIHAPVPSHFLEIQRTWDWQKGAGVTHD